MKVLLVKPYNRSDHIQPSLGLGYLATAARAEHDVSILDCIKEGIGAEKFIGRVRSGAPDVVGIQCYTFDLGFIGQALEGVKALAAELGKDIVTAVGGPHPTAQPRETMELFGESLDFAFAGEAEASFAKLLGLLAARKRDYAGVPGLVWRDGAKVTANPKTLAGDLDGLGFPSWDLIRPETYPEAQHGAFFKNFPIAPIMVTRGCPYPCTFCAVNLVSGRRIRRRSADNVLAEIKMLKEERGIREFHIIDDNFTMDSGYVKDFLRKLRALDLGMSWSTPNGVRMDSLDREMLGLMKETGLYLISLGIESGSDEVLGLMKKGISTSKIRECVAMIDEAGIDMAGFFILGFPGETADTISRTIRFAAELPLKRANFFTYLPFPGTESYIELSRSGELDGIDWNSFYFTNAAYSPRGLSRKKLKSLHRQAFAKFYLRPAIILYQLKSIKSLRHLLFLAKRFMRWIVHD
jgi:radical SAM superfamily enzyme YgiQ (UPF0313 family)